MLLRVGRTISASNISASHRSSGNVRRALVSGQAAALALHAGASSQARFPSFGQWAILPGRGAERPPGRGCLGGDSDRALRVVELSGAGRAFQRTGRRAFRADGADLRRRPRAGAQIFGYSEDGSTIV